ncbi:MAG: HupE/UreJ family protein [Acidobacteriota bacterium]
MERASSEAASEQTCLSHQLEPSDEPKVKFFRSPHATPGRRQTVSPAVILALGLVLLWPSIAQAHTTGESYVWLNVEPTHLAGRFELSIDDLVAKLELAIPEDAAARQQAIEATASEVQSYLRQHFEIASGGVPLPYDFTATNLVDVENLGPFVQYHYRTPAIEVPDLLEVRNTVFLEGDRFYRSLLCIEYDRRRDTEYGEEFTALVFSSANDEQVLDLTDIRALLRVRDFVWQGILHIWIGIDHVLFLVALLLTAVLQRSPEKSGEGPGGWQPVGSFRAALWNIIKIVTTFTVAHSITLSLAALDIISLPSQLVESIIALSIVLVAINNVLAKFTEGNWILIFFFGLFHGMGFASVMGELPFRIMHLVQVLIAFNLGVEIGQLVIVAAIFPLLFLSRRWQGYRPVILTGGSIAIGLMAAYWFIERAFGL